MRDYQFHRLNDRGAPTAQRTLVFATDADAIRCAITPDFPQGCDLWEGYRWLGRFYGPAGQAQPPAAIAA